MANGRVNRKWAYATILMSLVVLSSGAFLSFYALTYESYQSQDFLFLDMGFMVNVTVKSDGPFTSQKPIHVYKGLVRAYSIDYQITNVHFILSSSSATGALSFDKPYVFEEGIDTTYEFYTDDIDWEMSFFTIGQVDVVMLLVLETDEGQKSGMNYMYAGVYNESLERQLWINSPDQNALYEYTRWGIFVISIGAAVLMPTCVREFKDLWTGGRKESNNQQQIPPLRPPPPPPPPPPA